MNPNNFGWRQVSNVKGVDRREIGRFSERGTQIDFYRLMKGGRRRLPSVEHLKLLYVVKGTGNCGRHVYRRHTSIELQPGEAISFKPNTHTEVLSITIPSVVALGLQTV